jgi:DNA-binding MarR family transcriptional regulator
MAYVDSHPRHGAFLANQLRRLVDMIAEQGDNLLMGAGLSLPSRAVSSVLLIGERGQISAADIAKELQQPHQLVTQRIEILIELGLLNRIDDPSDGRRKILELTRKGKRELRLLETCLRDAERVFLSLYQEIECDLLAVTRHAMKVLSSKSILDRIATAKLKGLRAIQSSDENEANLK